MEREQVISIIRFYGDVDNAVRMNERVIKNLQDQYYNTLGAVNMDGMPHGKGGVSSGVERAVLHIPASVTATIEALERENRTLANLKAEILTEFNRLTFPQRAVLLGFYVERRQWGQIAEQVNYSPRQCRNIRKEALKLLGGRIERNKPLYKALKSCGIFDFPEK